MSKEETVEVTLKFPKVLVDFLRAMEPKMDMTLEKYVVWNIVEIVFSDLDSMEVFVPNRSELVKEYQLEKVFKGHNLKVPEYWAH